jgi:hypothetical protein
MKAEQFLQGTGHSGILILEASASLLLQCYFPKIDGDGTTGRGGSWCPGYKFLVCLGFFRGNRAPPWAKARLPGRWNRAKPSAEAGDLKPPWSPAPSAGSKQNSEISNEIWCTGRMVTRKGGCGDLQYNYDLYCFLREN